MRSIERHLASTLMAALLLGGAAVAQPPEPRVGPPPGPGEPGRLGTDDVVDRIMGFDKNKDGKVTKDELPERMQDMVARGDANKDGALDKDEIKKMASGPGGFGGGVGFGARIRQEPDVLVGPGPGPGLGFNGIEGVVEDLKLPEKKKDQAMAAVKAHQENVRKLMDQSRTELLKKMKEFLSEEELKDFQAALDRPRGGTTFFNPGPPDAPRPGEVERKVDQLQKELDELRRQLRR